MTAEAIEEAKEQREKVRDDTTVLKADSVSTSELVRPADLKPVALSASASSSSPSGHKSVDPITNSPAAKKGS